MISLCVGSFRGRLAHRRVLLERFVVHFNFPPFLVDYRHLFPGQIRIAADQIEHPLRAVLVGKDLPGVIQNYAALLQSGNRTFV